MHITKALIPAAGLGTRFLPITKSIPKEMLPLLNKPAIHYIIEEGLASGITDFYLIISNNKQAIKHYLQPDQKLEDQLKQNNKSSLLKETNALIASAQFTYIPQPEPLGLGHAILMAKEMIGDEYFGVFLPDDIIMSNTPGLAQLIRVAQQEQASIIAVQEIPQESISAYGVINIKKQCAENLFEVGSLVEKPAPEDAPSNLAIIGRYVLSPKLFSSLEAIQRPTSGEMQLTDAITDIANKGERVLAYKVDGKRFDLGTPAGWLKANVYYSQQG